MIKQLILQLTKKRKRYIITGVVLFLSFFVIILMLNTAYENFIKSCSPRLPIETNNRVELYLQWATKKDDLGHQQIRKQLKQYVLKLKGVKAADYVVNGLVLSNRYTYYDRYSDNTYLFYCGVDFDKVFNLKVGSGKWFSEKRGGAIHMPAVITRKHADFLGIKNINAHTFLDVVYRQGGHQDRVVYHVVGIVEGMSNMRAQNGLTKSLFPVFTPTAILENFSPLYLEERLILKMEEGYHLDDLNNEVLKMLKKPEGEYNFLQHRLTPLDEVLNMQVKKHFVDYKWIYGIMFVFLCYVFVTLFGTFYKITKKRASEIGIRRALGHSRHQVVCYILSEAMLLYVFVMVINTFVYLSVYQLINIVAPVPIYCISALILLLVIFMATWLPASQAGRVHPVAVLSQE